MALFLIREAGQPSAGEQPGAVLAAGRQQSGRPVAYRSDESSRVEQIGQNSAERSTVLQIFHRPVAARNEGGVVVAHVVGGVLDRRAMVALGAQTAGRYRQVLADVCLLGVWSLHPEHGITQDYAEEAELRRVLLSRADRVVGLATQDKLGTVAPFEVGPADALTHLVTDADAPDALVAPYRNLGVEVAR